MPNRIIDQDEKGTIAGTESIPGTEQTSTGETVPKNKRWTFNTIKTWVLSFIPTYYSKLGDLKSSDTPSIVLTDSAIVEVHIKVVSGTGKFKIGSTAGGSELMQLTDEITEDFYQAVFIPCYSVTAYPRVTGLGTLKVTLVLRRNIF